MRIIRKKIIDLLDEFPVQMEWHDNAELANFLLSHGVTVQQWIPVSERLPEWGAKVLIYTTFKDVMVAQWDGTNRIWVGDFCFYAERFITHWMPLPPAPEDAK